MNKKEAHFNTQDFQAWDRRFRANFFNSIGGYKSINLLTTKSKSGQYNLAPFFSVQHIGANPPLMSLIFRPHTVERHSLENFRESGKATVNAVHSAILEAAHQSSAKYPREVSEFEACGLHPLERGFGVPYLKEARLSFGIRHQSEHPIELNDTILLIASIEEVYLESDSLLEDGLIEHSRLDSLTVNGLDTYYQPQPYKRLSYAKPNSKLEEKKWPKRE